MLLMWACLANSGGGGNDRPSFRTLVMFDAAALDIEKLLRATVQDLGSLAF
jgi:hypothetical protein